MNEQKKELMLKAAVQFKGVWPDGYEALVVSTGTNDCWGAGIYQNFTGGKVRFNSVMGDADTWLWVCTKQEYEVFVNSLFEGAPDDATHYGAETIEYMEGYYLRGKKDVFFYVDRDWKKVKSKLEDIDMIIPRPRKQEVEPEPIDAEFVEWSDTGLPPVGVECLFDCTAKGKECVHAQGVVKYMSEYTCVMDIGGYEFVAHPDKMKFRPLKTEAEKEREWLALKLFRAVATKNTSSDEVAKTTHFYKDCLGAIDAGWRPSKD